MNQIFMNMVIHDMRNPASCIQFALKDAIEIINSEKEKLESLTTLREANGEKIKELRSQLKLQKQKE